MTALYPSRYYCLQRVEIKTMPEYCPRCSKAVYFAEQVLALGKKYHKLCLKCGKNVKHVMLSDVLYPMYFCMLNKCVANVRSRRNPLNVTKFRVT